MNPGTGGTGSSWLNVSAVNATEDWSIGIRGRFGDFLGGGADAIRVGFQTGGLAQNGFSSAPDYMFIQLDSYQSAGDSFVNSLQLHTSAGGMQASQFDLGTALEVEDYFSMWVNYDADTHTVSTTFDSDPYAPVNGSWSVDLSGEFESGAYYGFVGFTGGSSESHEIVSTSLNAVVVPEPGTLTLLAIGVAGVLLRRKARA